MSAAASASTAAPENGAEQTLVSSEVSAIWLASNAAATAVIAAEPA
ncbi:hypothetical protein AB0H49_29960 [Nocardia sp. NPDC050713]